MTNEWYYTKGDQQVGPVSASDLKAAAASGDLMPTSQVWKEGMAEWKPATNIKGLFDGASVPNPILASPPTLSETAAIADKPKKQSAMSSLLSTAKSAAQLAAKQAEKTKIVTITLPAQYQPLGKHCYESQQHRAEFTDLFQKLDAVRSQLGTIATSSEGKLTPQSLSDKAKATAGKAMQAAQSQKLSMQQSSLFGALGKAVYEAHGENSGPSNVIGPIAVSFARLAELDADISQLSSEGKGSWITPKRLAIAGAVVLGMFGLLILAAVLAPAVDQARQAARREQQRKASESPQSQQQATGAAPQAGNHDDATGNNRDDKTPSRDELIGLVYKTAAIASLKHTLGTGPSPEEFIELTHEAARQFGADKHEHSRFLLTLAPDKDKSMTVKGVQGRVLTYGSEQVIFLKNKVTDRYSFLSCTVDGVDKMNTSGR